jgi:hypothetical protein
VPNTDKDQISVYLPEPLGQRVREHAEHLGKHLTDVCAQAIERYMASPEPRLAELLADLQRLRSMVGGVTLQEAFTGTLADRVRQLEVALEQLRPKPKP